MTEITRGIVRQSGRQLRRARTTDVSGQVQELRQEQSLGQQIESIGNEYVNATIDSMKDAEFSSAFTSAQQEYIQRSVERLNQKTDDEGRATYNTLVQDLGSIGEEIQEQFLSNISNKDVADKFKASFAKVINNKKIQGLEESRRQHVDFSRANLQDSVNKAIESSLIDSPDLVNSYVAQTTEMYDAALADGVISAQEHQRMVSGTEENIRVGSLTNQINTAPEDMLSILNSDQELGIGNSSRQKLIGVAEAAIRDKERIAIAEQKEAQKVLKQSQNLAKSELELGMLRGTAGESDIESAFQSGSINELQRLDLLKSLQRTNNAADKSRNVQNDIEQALAERRPLIGISDKEVNNNYAGKVEAVGADTLRKKADIALSYTTPVTAFNEELTWGAVNGDLENASEVLSSFSYLNDRQAPTLAALPKQTAAILARASVISLNTTVGDKEAMRLAREEFTGRGAEQKQSLRTQFSKQEEFSAENITNTIQDIYDIDGFFGFGQVDVSLDATQAIRQLLESAYAETGDGDSAKAMVKAQTAQLFGVTNVGQEEFMLLPPEKFYPDIPSEDIHSDLKKDVESFGLENMIPDYAQAVGGVSIEDVRIEADSLTRTDSKNPTWGLYVLGEFGNKVYLIDPATQSPLRWNFDADTARKLRTEKQVKEGREARQESINRQQQTSEALGRVRGIGG